MILYNELPDIQREILRVIFLTGRPMNPQDINEACYYPALEVQEAIGIMHESELLIETDHPVFNLYSPSSEMNQQMQAIQDEVSAKLKAGIARLKQMLNDGPYRRDKENF